MYSKIIQMIVCRGCPLISLYPVCTACDHKAEFELTDLLLDRRFRRSMFSISPFWKEKEHESRWREEQSPETAPKGLTIKVPLVFG